MLNKILVILKDKKSRLTLELEDIEKDINMYTKFGSRTELDAVMLNTLFDIRNKISIDLSRSPQ